MPSATYYLDLTSGDDTNDGLSYGAPFKTVSKASSLLGGGTIGVFDSGTQIRVFANGGSGTSSGFYDATSGNTWVAVDSNDESPSDWDLSTDAGVASFAAWWALRPTFDGGGSGDTCPPYHALTMIGIIVDNGTDGVQASSSSADYEYRLQYCTISNMSGEGATNLGDLSYSGSYIKNCVFDSVAKSAIRASSSDDDADILIQGNLIFNCGTSGSSGSVIFLGSAANSTVEHNTIYGGGGSVGAPNAISATGAVVRNNIVVDACDTGYGITTAGTESYNCVYSSSGSYHQSGDIQGGAGTGSITTDPLFTDAGSDDYTLQASSPALHTGTNTAGLTYDLVGSAFEDPPSMGAYATEDNSHGQRIEHYFPGNDQALAAVPVLVLTDTGGPAIISVDTTVNAFGDWLQGLEDAANAHASLTETYTFSWSTDDDTVTLAATGNFSLSMQRDAHRWLGFTDSSPTLAASYTSDTTPHGFASIYGLVGVGYDARRVTESVKLRRYRHGRVTAYAQHHGKERTLRVVMSKATVDVLEHGPLFWGALKVTHNTATSSSFDLIPHAVSVFRRFGGSEAFAEVVIEGVEPDSAPSFKSGLQEDEPSDAVGSTATLGKICSVLPYGHGINYVVRIEGIPTLFAETSEDIARGNYTVDESLVIDDAAKVGSIVQRHGASAGIGRGYDLNFALTDTSAVRALFVRPSVQTALDADVAYTDTTITVADTTGFSSPFHLGTAAITYTGTTATTFTGCGIQTYGPIQEHKAERAMTQVTDVPWHWKGRKVWLYALNVNGFGNFHGDAGDALSDGAIIWQGHLSDEPMRDAEGRWLMAARSQDRRLDQSVIAPVTGDGEFRASADRLVKVRDFNAKIVVQIVFFQNGLIDPHEVECTPFTGFSNGALVPMSKVLKNIRTRWNNYWASITPKAWQPTVHAMQFPEYNTQDEEGARQRGFASVLSFTAGSSTDTTVWVSAHWQGGKHTPELTVAHRTLPFGSETQVLELKGTGTVAEAVGTIRAPATLRSLSVRIDEGAPGSFTSTGDIPSSGWVVIEGGGKEIWWRYSAIAISEQDANVVTVHLRDSGMPWPDEIVNAESVSVRFAYRDTGSVADLMRRQIQSSSHGTNGNYDTNGESWGYNIPDVDEDSFAEVFASGAFAAFNGELALDKGLSFTKLWSGLCAVSQRAIVPRRDRIGSAQPVSLTAIDMGIADSGRYGWTVTADDLVVPAGGGDPIRPRMARDNPNIVSVNLHRVASEKTGTIMVRDVSSIRAKGPEEWKADIYGVVRSQAVGPVTWWAQALFSTAQSAQVIEVDVVPWIDAQPGDQVYVNLPNAWQLWQWSTGQPGYVGPGRVLGDQFDLKTQIRTLTLAIDGQLGTAPISPSASIASWGGTASTPTSIVIDKKYFHVMRYFYNNAPSNEFDLLLYRPSEDIAAVASASVTIDDVTGTPTSSTTLSVSAVTGSFTLTTDWFATVPVLSEGTDEQDGYLHKGGGASWV